MSENMVGPIFIYLLIMVVVLGNGIGALYKGEVKSKQQVAEFSLGTLIWPILFVLAVIALVGFGIYALFLGVKQCWDNLKTMPWRSPKPVLDEPELPRIIVKE